MNKILVIEDNFEVRENICEVLELSGYQVESAENGILGVEKAMSFTPDLIICDIMMPELDGYGVLHIISKKPKTAAIPFIFLTAKTEKADFRKGMELGADDYITKPFSKRDLLNAIELRLKKSQRIKEAFDGTPEGLQTFINEAKGQKELEKLSEERESKQYKKKEFIYREGDYPRKLFFVISGKVKTFRTNEMGKEYITHIHTPGDFIGYNALLLKQNYTESAVAMEKAELSFIPEEDFTTLLHSNRDFASRFIKILTNEVEEKEEQLLSLAYNSIRKRVAEVLLMLHHRYEKDESNEINILRDDLAGLVGTAKESVIRNLTEFKSDGLIKIDQGKITILDKQKLENIPS